MFLPLKTEAHDGRFRLGALGIILGCILVHVAVWRDNSAREDKLAGFESQLTRHKADKRAEDMLKDVGGDGVFDDGSPAREGDSLAAQATQDLDKERKASLFYRLALVRGDFNPINLITNLFTHADFLHLFFNMWFFYLVGVTMEKYWGTGKFILLYLACGVFANLAFMLISGGPKNIGVPLVGASGAIAGMMGAFAATHGDAKVTMLWFFGFRMNTFQISSRVYLAFWILGQLWDGFLDSGKAGGVAFSAHIAGFLIGILLGKKVPGDVFYKRAYTQENFGAIVDNLVSGEKLQVTAQPRIAAPPVQDGTEVITLLNQARHALEQGDGRSAGGLLFNGVERAFALPGADPKILETALIRILESPAAVLPAGALYAWSRRLESIDWWQWAIRFYDTAANDPSPATNGHARSGSRFRAAVLRMDHLHEKDAARLGFQTILRVEPEGSFAEEAGRRLAALGSAPEPNQPRFETRPGNNSVK